MQIENVKEGAISGSNSSTALLGAAATFTGDFEANTQPDVLVSCFSSSAGTLYFDFSVDGTEATSRTFPTSGHKIPAGIHQIHIAVKATRAFRVRFVNGSVAQTAFQLYSYFGRYEQLRAPLNQSQTLGSDATMVRLIPGEIDIDLGGFSDIIMDTKHGSVEAIDALDNTVDIWAPATDTLTGRVDTKTFPTSASTFYMASDNASDTSKAVTIVGLASDGTETTVTSSTNASSGTTSVSLGTLLDVNRVYLSGDNQTLAGNLFIITADNFTSGVPATPSQIVAMIPIGYGQSQQIQISVPSDKRCRIENIWASIARAQGAAGSAEINLRVKEPSGSWRTIRHYDITSSYPLNIKQRGLVFPASSRITMNLDNVSDNDTNANAELTYEFIDV